ANAVGMAIAEAQLAARYNRPGFEVVDHATYAIVSDGDLMEGVASEAASLAGHLQLGKLTCLYDDNCVTLAAGTDITFSEDRARRFEAYGWHTVSVPDGNDLAAIDAALRARRSGKQRAHGGVCAGVPRSGRGVVANDTRRAVARLGRGHAGVCRRRQGNGDARGFGQGDERHRAACAGIDGRLRGSRPLDPHRAQGTRR